MVALFNQKNAKISQNLIRSEVFYVNPSKSKPIALVIYMYTNKPMQVNFNVNKTYKIVNAYRT